MKDFLLLLRPHQWAKNLFCLLPLFFDRKLLEVAYLVPSLWTFLAFCLAASGIYCLNDILDVEADRQHAEKRQRPLASGAIGVASARLMMVACWTGAIGLSLLVPASACLIGFYILLNIAYCTWLKRFPVIDVFCIASGFVLRVLAGGWAADIWVSHWILLMTFLLALFLALTKRRDDVIRFEATREKVRRNVEQYDVAFLNHTICIVASITMVCYIMYTLSADVMERFGSQYVYITSIYVLAGIIRYLMITFVDGNACSPTKILLKDRFLQATILGWLVTFAIVLYL